MERDPERQSFAMPRSIGPEFHPPQWTRGDERDRAIREWRKAGGDPARLLALELLVMAGHRTDWPGRQRGPEPR